MVLDTPVGVRAFAYRRQRPRETRVFDPALMAAYNYRSDRALAVAMGIDPSILSGVRSGKRRISDGFILGALRAFPGKTFDELFELDPEPAAVVTA